MSDKNKSILKAVFLLLKSGMLLSKSWLTWESLYSYNFPKDN